MKNEFKTRVQKSVPYLWPKWQKNGQTQYPIYDQNGWKALPFGAAHTFKAHIRKNPPPPRDFIACLHLSPLDWSVHKKMLKVLSFKCPCNILIN